MKISNKPIYRNLAIATCGLVTASAMAYLISKRRLESYVNTCHKILKEDGKRFRLGKTIYDLEDMASRIEMGDRSFSDFLLSILTFGIFDQRMHQLNFTLTNQVWALKSADNNLGYETRDKILEGCYYLLKERDKSPKELFKGALDKGYHDILEVLIDSEDMPFFTDNQYTNSLLIAIEKGFDTLAIKMIQKGGLKIETSDFPNIVKAILSFQRTEVFKFFIQSHFGSYLSVKINHLSLISYLIRTGYMKEAVILITSPYFSIYENQKNLSTALIERKKENEGLSIDDNILWLAIACDEPLIALALMENRGLIQMKTDEFKNPLCLAIEKGYLDVAEGLISLDYNLNGTFTNSRGEVVSPLLQVIKKELFELFDLLVEKGADVNMSVKGQTAVSSLILDGPVIAPNSYYDRELRQKRLSRLMRNGKIRMAENLTALSCALRKKHNNISSSLEKPENPLFLSYLFGDFQMINFFFDQKEIFGLEIYNSQNPLVLAIELGYKEHALQMIEREYGINDVGINTKGEQIKPIIQAIEDKKWDIYEVFLKYHSAKVEESTISYLLLNGYKQKLIELIKTTGFASLKNSQALCGAMKKKHNISDGMDHPAYIAFLCGEKEIFDALIVNKKFNQLYRSKNTNLVVTALEKGQKALFDNLIEANYGINDIGTNKEGNLVTPLTQAVLEEDWHSFELLLKRGASPCQEANDHTTFSFLALNNHISRLVDLVKVVNFEDRNIYIAFNKALIRKKKKVEPSFTCDWDINPIRLAFMCHEKELFMALLERKFIDKEELDSLIATAILQEYEDYALILMDFVSDVRSIKFKVEGNSLLKIIVKQGFIKLLKQFLDKRAEIETGLLVEAVRYERYEICEALLRSGANPNEKIEGNSPLLLALERENTDIARLLIEKGAINSEYESIFLGLRSSAFFIFPNESSLLALAINKGLSEIALMLIAREQELPIPKKLELLNIASKKRLTNVAIELAKKGGLPQFLSYLSEADLLKIIQNPESFEGFDKNLIMQRAREAGFWEVIPHLIETSLFTEESSAAQLLLQDTPLSKRLSLRVALAKKGLIRKEVADSIGELATTNFTIQLREWHLDREIDNLNISLPANLLPLSLFKTKLDELNLNDHLIDEEFFITPSRYQGYRDVEIAPEVWKPRFKSKIDLLESESVFSDSFNKHVSPSQKKYIINLLSHLLNYIHENPQDTKDVVMRIAGTFLHCTDRIFTELTYLYQQYIADEGEQLVEDPDKAIEQGLLQWLYNVRKGLIMKIVSKKMRENSGGDEASTQRFVLSEIGNDFGIPKDPSSSGSQWAGTSSIQTQEQLTEVLKEAFSEYGKWDDISVNLGNDILMAQTKLLPYQRFQEWFERRGISSDILLKEDKEGNFKIGKACMTYFLAYHGVIDILVNSTDIDVPTAIADF